MAELGDVTEWIRRLSATDPHARADAAGKIFLRGVESSLTAFLGQLGRDPEFRELILSRSTSASDQPLGLVVGIAVEPANFEKIRTANGSPPLADVPPDQDAMEFELQFQNHIELDILTTNDPSGEGSIARFLRKFGEGIQQTEVYVRAVDRATEILRTRFGMQPIYPATRPGANGTRVNFFLIPASDGKKALIELVEDKTRE